jgi:surfactin synthase thioesterase subunit
MNPFVRPRPVENPALRLVTFHHAGGSAALYHPLIRKLPARWDLLILDLPGRGKRHAEAPLCSMAEVVQRAVLDLDPWLDAPLALLGHSFGAMVAVETARALESLGVAPVWVGASGRIAPSFQPAPRRLHQLADEVLIGELLALGGTPDRIHEFPDFRRRFLELARADLAAVESYAPAPARLPLACPLTAFSGSRDPWAPPSSMLGWGQETQAGFAQRIFPGGHFYFLGSAFDGWTQQVVAEIERCCAAGTSRALSASSLPQPRREQGLRYSA